MGAFAGDTRGPVERRKLKYWHGMEFEIVHRKALRSVELGLYCYFTDRSKANDSKEKLDSKIIDWTSASGDPRKPKYGNERMVSQYPAPLDELKKSWSRTCG